MYTDMYKYIQINTNMYTDSLSYVLVYEYVLYGAI